MLRPDDGAPPSPGRAHDKSMALSLWNIYETLRISVPTMVATARGSLTKADSDRRLDRWARNIVAHASIELEVLGREHLQAGATYLVMSNHQSLYDVPVLFVAVGPNLRMVTKAELFRVPIFGHALRAGGFIPIERRNRHAAVRSLDEARGLLASGTHVWIAPEGTRSPSGELLPFKKGAFYLALAAERSILPVTLHGTRDALPARGVRSRPGAHVRVTIHAPIDPAPYATRRKAGREELMAEVRRSLESGL